MPWIIDKEEVWRKYIMYDVYGTREHPNTGWVIQNEEIVNKVQLLLQYIKLEEAHYIVAVWF